ncbi:MAG: putative bifunctional diguanylate cyclase/phosphodiesterase [Rubrivivax sp.]
MSFLKSARKADTPVPTPAQTSTQPSAPLARVADLKARYGVDLDATPEAARIRRLTCFDALTGLPNRLLLREQLDLVLRMAQRQGHGVAVMLVDIDNFRRLKQSLGHQRTDALIRLLAQRLQSGLRGSDLISHASQLGAVDHHGALARLGGNEFAVVLSHLADPQDAERVARRLREAASRAADLDGVEVYPTLSVGIALSATDGNTPELLLEHADLALGRAMDQGRDRTQFYNAAMDAAASTRIDIETGLRNAISQGQLALAFQPRVDGRTGQSCANEALLRWRHPTKGLLAPEAFIEVAEQSQLIVPMGRWVLLQACRQARAWQDAGIAPTTVGVNVSALQVCRPDFVSSVARALELSRLAPQWLELEVTESALLQDAGHALRALTAVKALGVRLAIDDFGTGFSSLSYLRDFPFDVLKIDRSFVKTLPQDQRTANITQGIIDISRRLGMEVVAEGVETEGQRLALLSYGCYQMQGFLFSRPADAAALGQVWGETAR